MTTQTESQIKHHPDDWSFTSDYHHHVDRTVLPVIEELSKWMTQTVPPNSSSTVLDDGCGLGTVTTAVKQSFPDLSIVAIDSSAGMLAAFNRKAKKHGWKNVETKLLDGGDLTDVPSASITHAFACTCIDFAHNATACIRELHRVIAPGGILGITTWADPTGTHPSISIPWTKACQELYPGYKPPLVTSTKWSTPEEIRENLEKAGFKDVQTKQVHAHWSWKDPEEMTEWFFNAGNPVCKRWHEALAEAAGVVEVKDLGRDLGEVKERFHKQLKKEYRTVEEGRITKEELVNMTIARE